MDTIFVRRYTIFEYVKSELWKAKLSNKMMKLHAANLKFILSKLKVSKDHPIPDYNIKMFCVILNEFSSRNTKVYLHRQNWRHGLRYLAA